MSKILPFAGLLLVLGASPSLAQTAPQDVPQGEVDALALLAMAPLLCKVDTEERWKVAMLSASRQYDVPIRILSVRVKRAMKELSQDLSRKPGMVAEQCALFQ